MIYNIRYADNGYLLSHEDGWSIVGITDENNGSLLHDLGMILLAELNEQAGEYENTDFEIIIKHNEHG